MWCYVFINYYQFIHALIPSIDLPAFVGHLLQNECILYVIGITKIT